MAEELDSERPATLEDAERMVKKLVWPKERQQANLHRFYEARLLKSEDPRIFVTRIRGLLSCGMPDMPAESRERLLIEQLSRAVPRTDS